MKTFEYGKKEREKGKKDADIGLHKQHMDELK